MSEETTTETRGGLLTTSVSRRWLLKWGAICIVGLGLGVWGLYDWQVAYPARGELHARFMLKQYLEQAAGDFALRSASVEDPAAEMERLDQAAAEGSLTALQQSRELWLTALTRLHSLEDLAAENAAMLERPAGERSDTHTWFVRPNDTLDELRTELQATSQPKPLSAYDLPVQALIMVAGFAVGGLLLLHIVRTFLTRYRYAPDERRLVLPSGRELTPDDIAFVDKRKWDKFFVFLKLKQEQGGEEIKVDLYRFEPLEEWILDMEPHTEGYEPEPEGEVADD